MLPKVHKVLYSGVDIAASSNSGAVVIGSDLAAGMLILNVTAQAGSSPTMDVSIENTPDGGTTWFEVYRFTQVGAATPQHQILANFSPKIDAGSIRSVTQAGTGALSANCVLSDPIRVKWTLGGSSPVYTFGVYLIAERRQV